MTISKFGINH